MSQSTIWKDTKREFHLDPEKEYSLICTFSQGETCTWRRSGESRWYLFDSQHASHISSPAVPSFSEMLDRVYETLITDKCLLGG